MSIEQRRLYASPFQQHLAFFDRNNDGFVFFGESLRGNLALGFDFPVALVMAIGYQSLYGNVRPFFFGPMRGIEISRVKDKRNMLDAIDASNLPAAGLDRKSLVACSGAKSLMDKMHVTGIWALAASRQGMISAHDIQKTQCGTILYEIEQRRKGRDDVLPLFRGGPISVVGHSWFVNKLFGVKVYQEHPATREK